MDISDPNVTRWEYEFHWRGMMESQEDPGQSDSKIKSIGGALLIALGFAAFFFTVPFSILMVAAAGGGGMKVPMWTISFIMALFNAPSVLLILIGMVLIGLSKIILWGAISVYAAIYITLFFPW